MKTSELNKFTQIIEHLVAKEVKKQLPGLISEILNNKVSELIISEKKNVEPVIKEPIKENVNNLKSSLKELFAGTPVFKSDNSMVKEIKQYTKDPILNQILNETTSDLRSKERMVGAAAFQGGFNPDVFSANNLPIADNSVIIKNQDGNIPLSTLPEGVSALDVTEQISNTAVKRALTRNYSELLKAVDKKKNR